MGWMHHLLDVAESIPEPELPKPVLRNLVLDGGLSIGSRVLVIGAANVRLPRWLDGLGIDVVVVDDDSDRVAAAGSAWPGGEIRCVPEIANLPFHVQGFDAILVRDASAPRSTIVEWAALLRAGGRLTFVDSDGTPSTPELDGLPGEVAVFEHRPQSLPWSTTRNVVLRLTSLRIPDTPIDRETWQSFARPVVIEQPDRAAA